MKLKHLLSLSLLFFTIFFLTLSAIAILDKKFVQSKRLSDAGKTATASLITNATKPEESQEKEKTTDASLNILLLGIHRGLTDTLLLASINPKKQTITLVSVPRDLIVKQRKINTAYWLFGIEELKKRVSTVTGLSLHHYAIFDFTAFKRTVDLLGGIEVNVERPLNDRFLRFHIEEGNNRLTGKEALQFARSRFSTSDFDRAKRQQEILKAVHKRILAIGFPLDIITTQGLYTMVFPLLKSDIGFFEGLEYMQKYQGYTLETGNVLSTGNFLVSTISEEGAYILLPRKGDFGAIQAYVHGLVFE